MIKKVCIFIFALLLLTGCSHKDNREVLTFSSWGSVTEVKILKHAISEFEKENSNLKINFIHIPQNYFQKIHLLFASNTAPDVVFMNNLYLPLYESYLLDLSKEFETNQYYKPAIEGLSYDGKLLGVPRDISNLVLYINLNLINLPKSTWTIEDLLKNAQNISKQINFGIGCEEDIYWILPYLAYYGGGLLDQNLNLIIDKEESKNGLNFYKDLIYKYKVAPTKSQIGSSTLAQMFLEEKIGIYLSGRWMYPKISENANFKWAVINFPYGQTPQPCDVSGWSIYKDSKHIDSAIKFVEFLSNKNNSEYFTQTGLIVPARIETAKLLNNQTHNEKVFLEVVKHSKNTFVNKNYKKLCDKYKLKISE